MAQRVCSVEGCDSRAVARGWCKLHYSRVRKHGDPHAFFRRFIEPDALCSVEGCDSREIAKGLCRLHYQRVYRSKRIGAA